MSQLTENVQQVLDKYGEFAFVNEHGVHRYREHDMGVETMISWPRGTIEKEEGEFPGYTPPDPETPEAQGRMAMRSATVVVDEPAGDTPAEPEPQAEPEVVAPKAGRKKKAADPVPEAEPEVTPAEPEGDKTAE